MNEKVFEFRTKTKNMLGKLDNQSRSSLNGYIRRILNFDEEMAFREIVKLKVAPDSVINQNPDFWDTMVDESVLSKICGDVIANYKLQNPDCWLSTSVEEFPEDLCKDLASDVTFLVLIRKRIAKRFESPIDVKRLQGLLTSQEEKNRYGGLRELGFTNKEAARFKNFTDSVWKFVSANFTPVIQEKEEKKKVREQTEEHVLTEVLLKHKDVIRRLFDAQVKAEAARANLKSVMDEVSDLGFDPGVILKTVLAYADIIGVND